MDNQTFGSSHLSSPALVVFSQAANGLSDALRLQRPFHSQLQDAKDLHHLSLVSSYGTHLLHGFQPHLFNHHLNPAVSSASSHFGSGGAFVKPFPSNLSLPSAFAPPKCLSFGLDQVSILLWWSIGTSRRWAVVTRTRHLTIKSSPNSRACCLATTHHRLVMEAPAVAVAEQAAIHSARTHRVQLVRVSRRRQRKNQWRDRRVKMVIVIEF